MNSKGYTTIPAGLRRKFGIQPGTRFVVTEDGVSIKFNKPARRIKANRTKTGRFCLKEVKRSLASIVMVS
ncbi:MAG: AbrB/MazE/SpoVT family DNA-binding domain-containing protein, partial [Anaerolineales bacterium]|nr:AbrB/MazE/SpoVT family DNA-binding domain-containing protein [Anaerolineales bacterium]